MTLVTFQLRLRECAGDGELEFAMHRISRSRSETETGGRNILVETFFSG
jgi:hypothetical protein